MTENKKPVFEGDGPNNVTPHSTNLLGMNQLNDSEELRQAMCDRGIDCRDPIQADGQIHRFSHQAHGDKDYWYVFYGSAGAFGDWSRDIKEKWSTNQDKLTFEERKIIQKQIREAQAKVQEEVELRHKEVAQQAKSLWDQAQSEGCSEYVVRKKVDPIGLRFHDSTLIIPLRDGDGKLWSLQYVHENGDKRFLKGGRKKGCFHILGELNHHTRQAFIVEGYATGASVYMATQTPTLVAFDAGNLELVVAEIKQKYPRLNILIAADDDQWKDKNI